MSQFGCSAQWHAVDASKIAAVGDRDPEVINGTVVTIREHSHYEFLRADCGLFKEHT